MKYQPSLIMKIAFLICTVSLLLGAAAIAGDNQGSVDIVNINEATVKELASLPGIGKKKAEAILAYRDDHGLFTDTQELVKVEGIGKKTYERIREWISVGDR